MRPYAEETVSIPSSAGILEGVLTYTPEESAEEAVLMLPPHPAFGGDLSNNVLAGVAGSLVGNGYPVLRFNYHGVGRSEGGTEDPLGNLRYWSHILENDDYELVLEDALASLAWIQGLASQIHLFGYSFGAVLALRMAAANPNIQSVVATALSVGAYDFDFLCRVSVPILALHSDEDFATTVSTLERTLDRARGIVDLVVLEGTDHFFRGRELEVGQLASKFFSNHGQFAATGRTDSQQ